MIFITRWDSPAKRCQKYSPKCLLKKFFNLAVQKLHAVRNNVFLNFLGICSRMPWRSSKIRTSSTGTFKIDSCLLFPCYWLEWNLSSYATHWLATQLKWGCRLLFGPISLLTKTSFDPLGRDHSSFRLSAQCCETVTIYSSSDWSFGYIQNLAFLCSIVSQKVVISFWIFWLLCSILCWIRIQIRNRYRSALWFRLR